jgi:hypothetical protein
MLSANSRPTGGRYGRPAAADRCVVSESAEPDIARLRWTISCSPFVVVDQVYRLRFGAVNATLRHDLQMGAATSQIITEIKRFEGRLSPIGRIITVVSAAISGVIAAYPYVHPYLPAALPATQTLVPWTILLQAFTVFCLVTFIHGLPEMREESKFKDAIAASKQFERFWLGIWLAWFGLYATWTIDAFFQNATAPALRSQSPLHLVLQYVEDLANLESASLFFLSYLVMVLKTTPNHIPRWFTIKIWAFALPVGLVVLEMAFSSHTKTFYAFHWFGGIVAGVTLALFVGRLESKFIDCSQWLLGSLYIYALIQASYAAMQQGDPLTDADAATIFLGLTSLALVLKILMFQYVGQVIGSGVLTYYMLKYRALFDKEPEDREAVIKELLV